MEQRAIFKSFWQAGFECSTHKLKSGKRLDLIASTQHDVFAEQDFRRLLEHGIRTVRESLRWHLIEAHSGVFDFSSALPLLHNAQKLGIQVIWDLFHFGWPDHLDIFEPDWIDSFGELATQFGRLLRTETSDVQFVAPVNEISFVSWAGGDTAYLNPFARGRGAELKRILVKAYLRAADGLRAELPRLRLVSPEPVIHIVGDPTRPDDVRQANEYRSAMFEAWDMLTGRAQPELRGEETYLDIIGVNYYDRNQWWNFGKTIWRHEPQYRPFREILSEVFARYQRPIFVSETGTEDEKRPDWLEYIFQEVRAAIAAGIPVHGICLYPVLNHPGWDDDRHCFNGLWDYPRPNGEREIYQPLAGVIHRHKDLGKHNHESTENANQPARHCLPLSSSLELRVPAAATPDEPLRTRATSLLC